MQLKIQRYDPEADVRPYLKAYTVDLNQVQGMMLLDVLEYIKDHLDPTLSIRRSCGGGVCGSDGMNVNGKNVLACQTQLATLPEDVTIYPMPGMPVVRDLVVDMSQFYKHFESVEPYLQPKQLPKDHEQIQSIEDRAKLDGLYECIMCGCCTSACPSSWWNPDKFVGPQGLLTAARFVADSRDGQKEKRLDNLSGKYKLYRCRGIFSCTTVCPKGLNPTQAIADLRSAQEDV
ncbi:succinate dehydrogenase iron-sulfur subunit [Candidatus Comchoanobacter bicostacola]|uniref:Succinate dehydrogenase iron-sulfur subunit n=1 Tax=Candidatus Comchoanobacter bicostacola TaxID=2919598 RepID=A0ABY5DMT0_9GAMM|nr:succinate dehydrogenase iron-sulfur subunit [Candidatus Comchoanobacter bicostacola]UTC24880.1 succinate dehydrogenase iron-sulfur subunit [Candidatus Comchoanobacter bicostacola]